MKSKSIMATICLLILVLTQSGVQTSHYTVSDPAAREMEASLDAPRPNYGAIQSGSELSTTTSSVVTGIWHLELSGGISMDLSLNQSYDVIFGRGNMVSSGSRTQTVVTSGIISGSDLTLNVVPANGMEVYAISLDLSVLPLTGLYARYGIGFEPETGNVKASWLSY